MEVIGISQDMPSPPRRKYGIIYALEPGESALLRDCNYAGLRSTLTYVQRQYGKRFSVRTLPDRTIRVWRTL